ncbi:hypothetical protein FNV43_RR01818 [Rhamnella rubrinervis]|uniref:Uncharacterized protein n=1 Tax=Rhamnella rubrinervis TaxID=2594499 RepID=A0A8K0MSE1_9ROSA|nr:hypothetical protein FNV43_RR01818 [Rhamnella rubrinervis]
MLNFALQSEVQALKLDFGERLGPFKDMYCLPEAIFSAKGITSLDLRGLRLGHPHVTLSCPSIENFRLEDCYGFTTPTGVEHVTFRGTVLHDEYEMNIASCYKSIKVSELIAVTIGEEWLETNSCVLHNVEKLILTHCNIEWSNSRLYLDKLKSVVVCEGYITVADEIEAPNLASFEFWSSIGRACPAGIFSILSITSLLKNMGTVELVDSVLWFAPRPNIISITTPDRPLIRSIKFTREDEPVKCGRGNSFEEVILENFDDKDNFSLETYFSETCKVVRFVNNINATNRPRKNYGLAERSRRYRGLHL